MRRIAKRDGIFRDLRELKRVELECPGCARMTRMLGRKCRWCDVEFDGIQDGDDFIWYAYPWLEPHRLTSLARGRR